MSERLPLISPYDSVEVAGNKMATLFKNGIESLNPTGGKPAYLNAVDAWVKHPDHGLLHGRNTFLGTLDILDHEPELRQSLQKEHIGNEELALVSYAHDFGQQDGLYTTPFSGKKIEGVDARAIHADQMASIVRFFGRRVFQIDECVLEQIECAIREHDATYEGRVVERPSALLQVLSDADKLFGSGFNENPAILMEESLARNRKGSYKERGWYLFRNDLSITDRLSWKYGARWRLDGISAALKEIFKTPYYTSYARDMNQAKQAHFLEAGNKIYGAELQSIQQWITSHSSFSLAIVGEGMEKTKAGEVEGNMDELYSLITATQRMPIKGRGDFRGVFISLQSNEQDSLLMDPSIARSLFDVEGGYDPAHAQDRLHQQLDEIVTSYKEAISYDPRG